MKSQIHIDRINDLGLPEHKTACGVDLKNKEERETLVPGIVVYSLEDAKDRSAESKEPICQNCYNNELRRTVQ